MVADSLFLVASLVRLMKIYVALKVEICVKHLVAYIALKPFHSTMDFKVLVQVCSLSKATPTVRHGTYIRPLHRVDSQMIKEIVPFSEPFFAVFMVALQNLNIIF